MPLCGAKDDQFSCFHISCQWGLTKTIWLVLNKNSWKFIIRSFGIGGLDSVNKIIDSTVSEISINLTHAKMKRRRAGFVFFGFFSVKLLVVISNGRWRCFRLTLFFFFFIASFSAYGPFHQFVFVFFFKFTSYGSSF